MLVWMLNRRIAPALASVALLAASCSTTAPQPAPPPTNQSPPQTATNQAAPQNPQDKTATFVWGSGWRIKVVPVFSGNALDSGTGTITVTEWAGGPRKIAYEFPPATSEAARPEVRRAASPVLHDAAITGSITISPDDAMQPVFSPPLYWSGGAAVAHGPLLWFSPDVMASLKTRKTATVTVAGLDGKGRQVTLTPSGTGEVVLAVNGQRTRFSAMRIRDDQGSLYTLVDAPQNPLVIRFRFGAAPVVGGKTVQMALQSGYDVVAIDGPVVPQGQPK
jgi:hypothetical protein